MASYIAAVLAVEYALAAIIRWRCVRVCPEMRGWYHASIVCCIVSSSSFVWLLTYGDSANRLLVVRLTQLVLVPTALIWPAAIAIETRRMERERAQALREKTGVL